MRSPILAVLLATAVILAGAGLARADQTSPVPAEQNIVTVHKTPWCGCCSNWVEHLRESGFRVRVQAHEDLAPIRAELGVPARLMSCHTASVGGYAVEGHVPAAEIRRLLEARPEAVGLSVPGMPVGSPGMESGSRTQPYRVILFGEDRMAVFAHYDGSERISPAPPAR